MLSIWLTISWTWKMPERWCQVLLNSETVEAWERHTPHQWYFYKLDSILDTILHPWSMTHLKVVCSPGAGAALNVKFIPRGEIHYPYDQKQLHSLWPEWFLPWTRSKGTTPSTCSVVAARSEANRLRRQRGRWTTLEVSEALTLPIGGCNVRDGNSSFGCKGKTSQKMGW